MTSRTNTTDKRLFVAAHKMSPATMLATEHGVARMASYVFCSVIRVNELKVVSNDALFIAAEAMIPGARNTA